MRGFKGGVHPKKNKVTAHLPIEDMPPPKILKLPLIQHIGAPLSPTVKKGDRVKKGQVIGDSEKFVSAPLHAPCSGVVLEIEEVAHPVIGTSSAIVIENDGEEESAQPLCKEDWRKLSVSELLKIIRDAGIVGLGGAAFPTHVKLSPKKPIDTLIINCAECEPYLSCDHRVMLECTEKIREGIRILQKILNTKKVYIGIEDDKKDAIKWMRRHIKEAEIVPLHAKYPQGGEKQLIKALTGREVPSGGLPLDIGVIVHNVQTTVAVAEALTEGLPLIQRVITVAGDGIKTPKNIRLRIGTLVEDVVNWCGGMKDGVKRIIFGGPMMGIAQATLDIPIIKGTSGILFLCTDAEEEKGPCIRCGACVRVCPMGLLPQRITALVKAEAWDDAKREGVLDCMECGCCSYVCPAHQGIVHYVKLAKKMIAQ